MDKPRAFVHFESDYYFDGGLLIVGKLRIPVSVLLAGSGLIMVALLVIFGIIGGVTQTGAWMFVPLGFLGLLASLVLVSAIVSLVAWMIRQVQRANR